SETSGTVTCEHPGILEAGQSAPVIELTVEVGPAAAPAVENTASVATEDDFNPLNNGTADGGTVIDIDNAVTISRTGTFRPGRTGTYLIAVENIGAVPTTGETVVNADLPEGLEFESAAGEGWTCGEEDRQVTCSYPAGLDAETSAPAIALRSDITTAAIPQVTTEVSVSTSGDRYPDNDTDQDTASVTGPDFAVSSTHEGNFQVGKLNQYTLEVRNLGSAPNTAVVTLEDELPAGFTVNAAYGDGWNCATAGSTVTCENPANIAAGQTADPVTLEVTPSAAALPAGETSAIVDNVASVTTDVDSNASNNTTIDPTDVVAVDLALGMNGPETVAVGEVAEFLVSTGNVGAAVAEAPLRVINTLPAGFVARSSGGTDWTCSSAGRKVNCSYGQNLAPSEAASELTIRAQAGPAAASDSENRAVVSAEGDVIPENDSASFSTGVNAAPDLEAGLSARTQSGSKFRVGSDGGYNVTVRNNGSAPTSGVTRAAVKLPAGMDFLGVDSGQGWTCEPGPGPLACEFEGVIAPDAISSFGFLAEISRDVADSVSAEATVEGEGDLNPDNDVAVDLTEVARIDLGLTRSHRPVWTAGGIGSYALRVANVGTASTAGPMTITETLPFGSTFAGASGEGWTCSVSGRRLNCVSQSVLTAGGVSELDVTLGLSESIGSELDASSTVKTVDDTDPSNDTATEQIAVESFKAAETPRKVRIRTAKTTATRSGVVTVWLECPATATVKCQGAVRLKSAGKVRLSARKRARLNLGKADYSVVPGKKSPVRFSLKKAGRKALVRNRKIRSKATASNGDGLGASKKSILIRAGK
ncbi:MAG: DUF11 domain-containing protein, partial [Actinomycetota bacterium]|nr:DUF11 domain-containing protein [Actinomycetota bacterium]